MTLSAVVFGYCERVDASFWAEPANALSNAGFLIAGWLGWRAASRSATPDRTAGRLALLVLAIGIGSFAFHMLATGWAALLDVIPITLFVVSYLFVSLTRFLAVGRLAAGTLALGFVLISQGLAVLSPSMNGSVAYLPAAAALWIVAALLGRDDALRPTSVRLGVAAAIFVIFLGLRSVDRVICPVFPLGTHFLWHVLNAVVLFLLLRALVLPPAETALQHPPPRHLRRSRASSTSPPAAFCRMSPRGRSASSSAHSHRGHPWC